MSTPACPTPAGASAAAASNERKGAQQLRLYNTAYQRGYHAGLIAATDGPQGATAHEVWDSKRRAAAKAKDAARAAALPVPVEIEASEQLLAVVAQVQETLGDLIDILDREGGRYAREYAAAMADPERSPKGARRPYGMPLAVAQLIRSLVLEEMMAPGATASREAAR